MNEITEFTAQLTRELHAEAAMLLAPLEAKYGIKVLRAGGNFSRAEATLKFSFVSTSEQAERTEFNRVAHLFHCKAEDYGREARVNGKQVVLIGFELKRRKFPVKCRSDGGKIVLFAEEVLHRHFHTGKAPAPRPAAEVSLRCPLVPTPAPEA